MSTVKPNKKLDILISQHTQEVGQVDLAQSAFYYLKWNFRVVSIYCWVKNCWEKNCPTCMFKYYAWTCNMSGFPTSDHISDHISPVDMIITIVFIYFQLKIHYPHILMRYVGIRYRDLNFLGHYKIIHATWQITATWNPVLQLL